MAARPMLRAVHVATFIRGVLYRVLIPVRYSKKMVKLFDRRTQNVRKMCALFV